MRWRSIRLAAGDSVPLSARQGLRNEDHISPRQVVAGEVVCLRLLAVWRDELWYAWSSRHRGRVAGSPVFMCLAKRPCRCVGDSYL